MGLSMKITSIIRLTRLTCLYFLLLLMVACGGGGGAEVDQSLNDPNTLNNSNTVSDGDNDGFDDDQDNCPADSNPDQSDLDNDGSGDACDSDDDGDGVDDTADNCSSESNADQTDTDNDGIGDACDPVNNNNSSNDSDDDGINDSIDNCPNIDNPNQADNDNDGSGDLCDSDDDNDGINDSADNCSLVSNQDQSDTDNDDYGDACDIDDDGDTVTDASDNCPLIENQDQADQDNDGIGDACDPVNNNNSNSDTDNDGIVDSSDNCPTTANTNQQDSDNDGIGDACDTVNDDPDMDGVLNPNDNCPTIANSDQADADSDSIGDACDSSNDDPDLDGVLSANDNCPTVDNSDQLDTDNDGIGDACDSVNDDPDNDGILNANDNCPDDANPIQEDSDNNGVGDVCDSAANQLPSAINTADTTSGVNPLTVNFDGSNSTDPDGNITSYNWDFGDGNTANTVSAANTYTVAGNYSAILTVTDNDGGTDSSTLSVTVTDDALPIQSISQGVQASDDDAEQKSDTTTNTGSSDLEMVQDFSETQTIGIRFDQLAVPRNATITAAWIQFTADEENDEPTNLVIEGERTGNSFEFDWEDSSVTNRPRTNVANHVNWSPAAWEIDDAGDAQKTPDLSAIVQEIVNLTTWDYESAMSFIISGSGKRVAYSYDSDPAKAAVLHVEFQSNYVPPTIDVLRGPYLQQGTTNSMIIRWRTDVAGDSVVHYGTTATNLNITETISGNRTEHEVKLTGLSADSRYYYAIETNGEDLSGLPTVTWFETNPVIGSTEPVRVWVIGDPGTADSSQQSVYNAYNAYTGSTHTDLWIMLGDNAYPDGTDEEYQAAMYDVYPDLLERSVVWPTLGNHDQRSASSFDQSGVYFDMFSLPKAGEAGGEPSGTEAYYSFDYGNIHFICLNSVDVSTSSTSAQMEWLNNDLDNNNQTWTIAFWHHPPYSKGSHDSDTSGQETDMREEVLPILEAKGIDLVLSGHSHSYERSFLLDGHYHTSDTLEASMIKDDGDGSISGDGAYQKQFPTAANDGAIYSVVGASGKTSDGPLDHPVMIYSEARLGSLVIDVTDKTLKATYIDNFGNARDDFTIEK